MSNDILGRLVAEELRLNGVKWYSLHLARNSQGKDGFICIQPARSKEEATRLAQKTYREKMELPASTFVITTVLHTADTEEESAQFHTAVINAIAEHKENDNV